MSNLRRVLHVCADLIADALEKDALEAATKPPKKTVKRSKEKLPEKIDPPQIDEFTRRTAHAAMRRAGLL